jgi:hypothetical protein
MIPKTIIRDTNIPAPPGTDPIKIMAKWIAQMVREDRAKAAVSKERNKTQVKTRGGESLDQRRTQTVSRSVESRNRRGRKFD